MLGGQYVPEEAGARSVEAGEHDRRGNGIALDTAGVEGHKAVCGAQVDAPVPGREAGVGGEQRSLHTVVSAEFLHLAVQGGPADDGSLGGQP